MIVQVVREIFFWRSVWSTTLLVFTSTETYLFGYFIRLDLKLESWCPLSYFFLFLFFCCCFLHNLLMAELSHNEAPSIPQTVVSVLQNAALEITREFSEVRFQWCCCCCMSSTLSFDCCELEVDGRPITIGKGIFQHWLPFPFSDVVMQNDAFFVIECYSLFFFPWYPEGLPKCFTYFCPSSTPLFKKIEFFFPSTVCISLRCSLLFFSWKYIFLLCFLILMFL